MAFSEIVKVTGTPTLSTNNNWGSLSYVEGSGTNVLTFSTTIPQNASGNLSITGLNGTVKDLAGKSLVGSGVTASNLCSLNTSYAYHITYDLAGGSVATANPTTYTYETATFSLNNPTKLGYNFTGWTGSNGNTPQTTVSIAYHSHGDKYYTANWDPHTYSVRFHANDGTGTAATGTMDDQDFTYGVAQNLTANAFERTGYTFAGWNTQADGNGTSYTDQQSVSNLTPENGATFNLYAQWTANQYTVTLDQQIGSGGTTSVTATFDAAMPDITIPTSLRPR
ncbi:MAG: InlB B-repeat-containing protein [Bacteroidales bacterium]|nr:InlB B-repeat-containing protein [Bacteroidales bacterium]